MKINSHDIYHIIEASKLFILIEPDDSSKYSRLKDLIKKNTGATKISFATKMKKKNKSKI